MAKYAQDAPIYNSEQHTAKPEYKKYTSGNAGVQCGAFSSYESASAQIKRVNNATGMQAVIERNDSGLYRVRINGLSDSAAQSAKNNAFNK